MRVYKKCLHDSPTSIGSIDNVDYYCCALDGVREFGGDLIVNLTGISNFPSPSTIPSDLAPHIINNRREIIISWPDFGVPSVKSSFWQALHQHAINNNYQSVCIHCQGGHGRTGTAVSALLISVLGWDVREAVDYVRDNYCAEAVETDDQAKYLYELDKELNNSEISLKDAPLGAMYVIDTKDEDPNRDDFIPLGIDEQYSTYEPPEIEIEDKDD
jgi:hypothetical protein